MWQADFVAYDDPAYVLNNQYVSDGLTGRGVRWAFTQEDLGGTLMHRGVGNLWHPVTWISHMIDAEVFGMENATGHHAVSLFWHLVAVVLCYLFLLKIGASPFVAVVVAAIFAVHPMRVESVAWISERKDVLSGAFFFATLLAYVSDKKRLGLVFFALALMSKPSVVVLPMLLVLLEWWRRAPHQPVADWKRFALAQIKEKWAWFALSAGAVVMTLTSQYGGTQGEFVTPLGARLLYSLPGLGYYLHRTFLPVDLSFHYPFPGLRGLAIFGVTFLAVAVSVRWWPRALVFGGIWFVVLWLPVSGLAHVGTSFTADRYVYLAHVGLFFGLVQSFPLKRWPWVAAVVIFGGLAFQQSKIWQSSEALFAHAAEAQPRDVVGIQNLGALQQMAGADEAAVTLFERALALQPNDYIGLTNLGRSYWNMGRKKEAVAAWEKAVAVYPTYHPGLARLAQTHLEEPGFLDPEKGEDYARRALQASGGKDLETLQRLLVVFSKNDRMSEATKLIETLPESVRAMIKVERR